MTKIQLPAYCHLRKASFQWFSTPHWLVHRMVAEFFGCPRDNLRGKHTHHRNFNRSDNRIANLQIMTSSEHMKLHALLRRKERE